jgi:conjugal transfer pilus assembly protein TraW
MIKYIKILLIIMIFISSAPVSAAVKDLGTFAETYPIAEKDAIDEILENVQGLDFQSVIDPVEEESKIMDFKPETLPLPKATKDRQFLVDMTYTLDIDVPDKDGDIIYPAGYQFNPLEHMTNPMTYIFIDANDKDQVNWFIKSPYANNLSCRLLITEGEYFDLSEKLERPVYYALSKITERFQLEYVPSIVSQHEQFMKVIEVNIEAE